MVTVKNLSKSYGSRPAVSDLSFTVNKGEIIGFLGPNGAGKTTTMKILTGYMAPNKGQVSLDGLDIFKEPFLAKKKIGYLPEIPPVYVDMRVEEYLYYVARLKLCSDIPKLVERAVEKLKLGPVRNRLIGNLSKGFKQRVGLAQALVSDPEILILDEPTVGLDPKQVIEIRETLKNLKGSHTIILSTHILSEVQMICDRVIIINEGRIVTQDSLEELSLKMRAKRKIILRLKNSSSALTSKFEKIKGVLSVQKEKDSFILDIEQEDRINQEVAQAVIDSPAQLMELREQSFNLEDVFIRLTDGSSEKSTGGKL